MSRKSSVPIIAILATGALLAWGILNLDTVSVDKHEHETELEHADAKPRGKHGGWLFSKDNFLLEVKIFEKGVPPQFRVYATDSSGTAIDLHEIKLTIHLHRLGRIDKVQFKPSGEYLLGDKIVEEPHSFDVKIYAQWKGQDYEWEFSQIEARAELSEQAIKNAGITIDTAGPASLKNVLRLTGEIGLNEEGVVHIVPRLDGVVKKTYKNLGDHVVQGDIIAIIESRELADAKTDYLAALQQAELAKADLQRETRLLENTSRMLDLLEQELDLEEVFRELKGLNIGKSRELLIPAYAKLKLSNSVYTREKRLFEKGISSESEYLLSREDYKSAEAKYAAAREKIAYDGQWTVREKMRTREVEQLHLQTAKQKLFALGLSQEEVDALSGEEEHVFTQYELRASINGTIIKKHLTTGEAVKSDDDIFMLADLSEVWVNIAIPAKDMKHVRLGQKVIVKDSNMENETKGKLTYLGSIVDEKSRTITGRVVIPNPEEQWRPGSFVSVELILDERSVPISIEMDAIQTIRDWSVVFVKYGNLFEARPLDLGENDGRRVEVLHGLSAGDKYVSKNSFVVKAEIEKSSAVHDH